MRRFFKAGILGLAILPLLFSALARAQAPPPADKVFSLAASRDDDDALTLRWTAAPDNYLYRDSLQASLDGKTLPLEVPAGQEKDDPNFGHVEIFHGSVEVRLSGLPAMGTLEIRYQGCAEKGICYPRIAKTMDLATLSIASERIGLGGDVTAETSPTKPVIDPGADYLASNPLLMSVAFLGFGLLLAFTPCTYPMIPILLAMLAGIGERPSIRRGFTLSSAYVLAMAAAYGIVGLIAGWSGANLQTALQTPVALLLAAAVFVALALSMFGFYEIALPMTFASRLSGARSGGSLMGAAVLGLGSALIVGPCVTPPLAAAMLFAVQSGEAMKGAAALFSLGLGMGLPLIALGTFGTHILPRSGFWMVRVRQIFGVVFLGVAAMLAARLLAPPAALALWGALALGTGVFLGAFDVLTPSNRWPRRLGKTAGLAASLYGAALLLGAAGGANDPLQPLAFLAKESGDAVQPVAVLQTNTPAGFDAALAAHAGTPILITFKADWCTVCKSNEKVMARPDIRRRLNGVPVIAVDVTKQDAGALALMTRFSVVGPPTLLLLDSRGHEVPGSRMIGPISADEIAKRLSQLGA